MGEAGQGVGVHQRSGHTRLHHQTILFEKVIEGPRFVGILVGGVVDEIVAHVLPEEEINLSSDKSMNLDNFRNILKGK